MTTAHPQWDTWPPDVQWQSLSPRFVLLMLSWLGIIGVPALAVVFVQAWVWWGWQWATVAAVLLAGFEVLQVFLIKRRAKAWGYAEREADLLIRHGVWTRKLSIVPYSRMQFIDINAGPVERMFSLATVTLNTAAATSDSTVPGLAPDVATGLRDRLSRRAVTEREGL